MRAYVDADVMIWHLRGKPEALSFFKRLRQNKSEELWTSAMQRAEVVFFMKPREEGATLLFLSQFKTEAVDQSIVDSAAALYRKWNPSHGTDINDAILAATVMKTGGKIYCLNRKHYPMNDVVAERAWV
jgi:predicted nucleic acid-binding protein